MKAHDLIAIILLVGLIALLGYALWDGLQLEAFRTKRGRYILLEREPNRYWTHAWMLATGVLILVSFLIIRIHQLMRKTKEK